MFCGYMQLNFIVANKEAGKKAHVMPVNRF